MTKNATTAAPSKEPIRDLPHTIYTKPPSLPHIGMSRWQQLRHFIPVSRESWRKLVIAGRAPAPVKLSERCTMYQNHEVHRWLSDPTNFRVEA